jgi:hypothetical protein
MSRRSFLRTLWKGDGSAKDIRVGLTPEQKQRHEYWEKEIKRRTKKNPGLQFWSHNQFYESWSSMFSDQVKFMFAVCVYGFGLLNVVGFFVIGPRDLLAFEKYLFFGIKRKKKVDQEEKETHKKD